MTQSWQLSRTISAFSERKSILQLDDILSADNISYTGENIRQRLNEAGYVICRMPGGKHEGACPTCGCEPID